MPWLEKLSALKNKKTLIIGVVLISLGLIGSFFLWGQSRKVVVAENIKEVTVRKGDLKINFTADGKVDLSTVALNFPMNGTIKEVTVTVGTKVKAGDVIARLDAEKYELDLQSARANYQAAQAKLANARESYNDKLIAAKEKMDQAMIIYQPMSQIPEVFSRQELASKKSAAESAQQSYEAAKAGTASIQTEEADVAQTLAALKKAEKNLSDTELRSPIDGDVIFLAAKEGESYSYGSDNAEKSFAVVAKSDNVSITAQVLELDVPEVSLGQGVEVKIEALREDTFSGKVTGIDAQPVADASGIINYGVQVLLDKPDPRIKNGMTATVSFIIEQKKDVLIIPNSAVKRVDGSQVVEKIDEKGQSTTQKVKTGFTDGTNVEVMEGLKLGEKIVVRTPISGSGEKQ